MRKPQTNLRQPGRHARGRFHRQPSINFVPCLASVEGDTMVTDSELGASPWRGIGRGTPGSSRPALQGRRARRPGHRHRRYPESRRLPSVRSMSRCTGPCSGRHRGQGVLGDARRLRNPDPLRRARLHDLPKAIGQENSPPIRKSGSPCRPTRSTSMEKARGN